MVMSGRWGFLVNWVMRSEGSMSSGDTPGKLAAKKLGSSVFGSWERVSNVDCGAKSVHVKDLSRDGIAMNMKCVPGQMWRWFGDMAKSELLGWMWNSHHRVSMYSCW